jgi:hypothetical protein
MVCPDGTVQTDALDDLGQRDAAIEPKRPDCDVAFFVRCFVRQTVAVSRGYTVSRAPARA